MSVILICISLTANEAEYTFLYLFVNTISSSGEGNGTPLQYSCLENPMDGGPW